MSVGASLFLAGSSLLLVALASTWGGSGTWTTLHAIGGLLLTTAGIALAAVSAVRLEPGRLRRSWSWLWSTTPNRVLTETWTCPDCGASVEVPASSPAGSRRRGMWLPPTDAERRRACPNHG